MVERFVWKLHSETFLETLSEQNKLLLGKLFEGETFFLLQVFPVSLWRELSVSKKLEIEVGIQTSTPFGFAVTVFVFTISHLQWPRFPWV